MDRNEENVKCKSGKSSITSAKLASAHVEQRQRRNAGGRSQAICFKRLKWERGRAGSLKWWPGSIALPAPAFRDLPLVWTLTSEPQDHHLKKRRLFWRPGEILLVQRASCQAPWKKSMPSLALSRGESLVLGLGIKRVGMSRLSSSSCRCLRCCYRRRRTRVSIAPVAHFSIVFVFCRWANGLYSELVLFKISRKCRSLFRSSQVSCIQRICMCVFCESARTHILCYAIMYM